MTNGYEPAIQDFIRHARSTARYKAIVVVSPSLKELAQFATKIQEQTAETCRIDALKIIKTGQLRQVADPLNTKYWLYNQTQPAFLNSLIHFDWVIGKWTRQQSQEWWQLLAQLEVPLILCTILKPLSEHWQMVANASASEVAGRLMVFKPSLSKFSFTTP